MSHSIHATRRDPRVPGDLSRKRLVKDLVAVERQHDKTQLPHVPVDAIPITVHGESGYVRFPASVEDLRALMARLPPGCLAGIRGIELSLGAHAEDGAEIMPGVFGGRVLGRYTFDGPGIHLFAYVYDPSRSDRAILDAYLRLRMLSTFVHEVGHHLDISTRDARGRWRSDDEDQCEVKAEAIEYAWTREYVIPYLEEAHEGEMATLKQWIIEHAGLALPLDLLAGDPRQTLADSGHVLFTVDNAFEHLFGEVARGARPPETHLDFARELHYAEHYDEALAIITNVLGKHPDHATALTLRADIFVHQDRLDDALEIARGVLLVNADSTDAWEIVRDVGRAKGQWPLVLEGASRGVVLQEGWRRHTNLVLRARAFLELGDLESAERDLADLSAADAPESTFIGLRAIALLRGGHPEEALTLATSASASPRPLVRAELAAVRIEAEHALHRPSHRTLAEDERACLQRNGYTAWIVRLDALVASSRGAPSETG